LLLLELLVLALPDLIQLLLRFGHLELFLLRFHGFIQLLLRFGHRHLCKYFLVALVIACKHFDQGVSTGLAGDVLL